MFLLVSRATGRSASAAGSYAGVVLNIIYINISSLIIQADIISSCSRMNTSIFLELREYIKTSRHNVLKKLFFFLQKINLESILLVSPLNWLIIEI